MDTSYTILVANDDAIVTELLVDVLTHEGHQVVTATNSKEVVTLCRQQPVHLLILDDMVGGTTGEKLARTVRTFDQDAQIIIQSAPERQPSRQLLRETDILGYHNKDEKLTKLLLWVDIALRNYEQIQRRALESSFMALGLALEARDLETAGHTNRVVNMAVRLGQQLGLDNVSLEALRQGAFLHDLGKLCIPDAVLHKPARLDQSEWEIMKTHARRGYELAATLPSIRPEALDVIQYHHEHWDGYGYPARLDGPKIPLLARIFAICDVYDALISPRTYKPAWSPLDAIQEVQQKRSSHFDPLVVDHFVELWRTAAFDDLQGSGAWVTPTTPKLWNMFAHVN
jgi:HD-GYP domain-containing protein (c-di-GMP phosphodiesterase class II)